MKLKKLIIILVVLGLAVAGVFFYRYKVMMKPARTTHAEFEGLAAGDKVKVIGEIKTIKGDSLEFEVLENPPGYNKRTGAVLKADGISGVEIIMGKQPDVKVGGIAQFSGTKGGDNQISLTKIVILTKFIKGPSVAND